MNTAPMLRVEARGELVSLTLGDEATELTPREAQRFAFYLARAYTRAGGLRRTAAGNMVIDRPDPVGSSAGHTLQNEREAMAC